MQQTSSPVKRRVRNPREVKPSAPISKSEVPLAVPSADLSSTIPAVVKSQKGVKDDEPYPSHQHPSPAACLEARDALAKIHDYDSKEGASNTGLEKAEPKAVMSAEADCHLNHSQQSVLDSLVRTILSQNTTDKTSLRAFTKLKSTFPTWEEVLAAPSADVEESIREGGLAEIKCQRIKTILTTIKEEAAATASPPPPTSSSAGAVVPSSDAATAAAPPPPLSLEHLRAMSTEDVKATLGRFKGVGPKTISCVLMFTLNRAEFPVDTHVWRISKRLGWVPPTAGREQAYEHLNRRLPSELKYDLHVLLVAHGKVCAICAAVKGKGGKGKGGPGFEVCPLRPVGKALAAAAAEPMAAPGKSVKVEKDLALKVPPAPQSSMSDEEDKFVPETPPIKKQKR